MDKELRKKIIDDYTNDRTQSVRKLSEKYSISKSAVHRALKQIDAEKKPAQERTAAEKPAESAGLENKISENIKFYKVYDNPFWNYGMLTVSGYTKELDKEARKILQKSCDINY